MSEYHFQKALAFAEACTRAGELTAMLAEAGVVSERAQVDATIVGLWGKQGDDHVSVQATWGTGTFTLVATREGKNLATAVPHHATWAALLEAAMMAFLT